MEPNIENILEQITWGDVLELGPCGDMITYSEDKFGLKEKTRLCSEYLNAVREYNKGWVDWFLYEAASRVPNLTGEQMFSLVSNLENEPLRYEAARNIFGLTGEQMFSLVSNLENEPLRYEAACNIFGLTREQAFSLVKDLKDKYWRVKAAHNVSGLTEKQKEELLHNG